MTWQNWGGIYIPVREIVRDALDPREMAPCPKCGGTRVVFNMARDGFCRRCGRHVEKPYSVP